MTFAPVYWYWFLALVIGFLPLELFAAKSKKPWVRGGTFSEFVWWAFGVKRRLCTCSTCRMTGVYEWGAPVRWAFARRLSLSGMCLSLSAHFIFGTGVEGVVAFGIPVGIVLIRAIGWERA